MTEMIPIVLAGVAGGVLGLLFFSGLWWTIRISVSSRHPALIFMTSFLLRSFTVVCGFYFVAGSHWKRMAACLLGFIIARFIITHGTNLQTKTPPITRTPAKEANHAPES